MRLNPKYENRIKVRMEMSRDSNREWNLSIHDDASSMCILRIKLDHEQFSNLLSTMTTDACGADYFKDPNIGKKLEAKTVTIDLRKLPGVLESYDEKKKARDLKQIYDLAEEENPGWTADRDKYNHYKLGSNTYGVTLRRYT